MGELLDRGHVGNFELEETMRHKVRQLCATNVWGFREIVLVMCIGRLLDPGYAPTSRFYDCNPRAIYEGPIRDALYEAQIPHGKSGPLNVAKAAPGINPEWAAQRRPREIAQVAVELAEIIEKASAAKITNLASGLLAELLAEAQRIAGHIVEIPKNADPVRLTDLCFGLINEVPDAGNTPQRIVGLLLEIYHEFMGSEVEVTGHLERASVTSTTSKKPGDIMERSKTGRILSVYEVSVKPFDEQRASDSYEAVQLFAQSQGQVISEVIVICRNVDVHPSAIWTENDTPHLAILAFRGLTYHFLNIYQWVASALIRLGPEARIKFYTYLNNYIGHPNTSEKVKIFWRDLHQHSG